MKVAVCISGALKSGNPKGQHSSKRCLTNNNKIIRSKFPTADFYYATWDMYKDEFEKTFPDYLCNFFPEPQMHYHPYLDVDEKDYLSQAYKSIATGWARKGGQARTEWTSHHTKQILIHSWLISKIKDQYDIIVRARFDGFISKNADFTEYIKDTYNNKRANCFGTTKHDKFDNISPLTIHPDKANYWMIDQLIIHPADAIDVNEVNQLHNQKKLLAAEYGWCQVISMPYGSNHRNFTGWVNPDWSILENFLYTL